MYKVQNKKILTNSLSWHVSVLTPSAFRHDLLRFHIVSLDQIALFYIGRSVFFSKVVHQKSEWGFVFVVGSGIDISS